MLGLIDRPNIEANLSLTKSADKNTAGNFLHREKRLRATSDFKRVYQSKQWGSSQHYTFNILPHDLSEEPRASRLGVTVSKKVAKQAVIRNRLKRQIKEFYRHRSEALSSVDLVISAKPSCAKTDRQQRHESLEELWQKILKWQRWYLSNHAQNSKTIT